MLPVLFSLPLLISSVRAKTIFVQVGSDDLSAGLRFYPETVHGEPGDEVQFMFPSKSHTVTQSSFLEPCAPLLGTADQPIGFDFVAAEQDSELPTYTLPINDTNPVWAYCKEGGSPRTHCQSGMVFAINPPKTGRNFEVFKELAYTSTAQNCHPHRNHSVTHTIKVGGPDANGDPLLLFDPEYIQANPGDVVNFDFGIANHTATVSSFFEPCVRDDSAFDSGFFPVNASTSIVPTAAFTVQDTTPIWMYCRQPKGNITHCQAGMVFAVNPPPTGHTFAEFKALAMNSTSQDPPANQSLHSVPSVVNLECDGTSHSGGHKGAVFKLLGTALFFAIILVGITGTLYARYRKALSHVRSASLNYRPDTFPSSKPHNKDGNEYQRPSGRYTNEN